MGRFVVTTEGNNKLNLRTVCEEFVNTLWIPTHLTPELAVKFAVDCFKRTLVSELELLDVSAVEDSRGSGDGA